MRRVFDKLTLACCVAAMHGSAFAAQRWYPSLAVSSEYVVRGISQSGGETVAQGGLSHAAPRGPYAGFWASTILARRPGDRSAAGMELDLFAGTRRAIGHAWTLDIGVVRYMYPQDDRQFDYDYTELVATLDYRGRAWLTLTASPDTSLYSLRGLASDRAAYSVGMAFEQPVTHRFGISAGVGYYDLRELYDTGYGYWNAGITWQMGNISVDVTHMRTDSTARALFGDYRAGPHTVLTVSMGL